MKSYVLNLNNIPNFWYVDELLRYKKKKFILIFEDKQTSSANLDVLKSKIGWSQTIQLLPLQTCLLRVYVSESLKPPPLKL